jgi:selenocysteine-specific elongation factor
MNRYVILGTAGHIDHGKSALVKALTGTDPDRLKEEKERGITIDLGFAFLHYTDGLNVGIVDVPGHERLIKNMLAGAGGIDMVLLVIAADEGVMPQTREHLAICNLLGIKKGLIAVTKSDLAENDWLELVKDDLKNLVRGTFLEDADIIPVSSKTGLNIDLLKERIREAASEVKPKPVKGIFRLPVDRVFTMKGFGTVVTGTAVSGNVGVDAPLEVLPGGITAKLRSLQSHGETLKKAYAGQRVSFNLQGIEKQVITRGDVLAEPGKIKPTSVVDARVELVKDDSVPVLKNRSLVHFHTGTSELTGRIILYGKEVLRPGDHCFCQFRFGNTLAVMAGDRYIIRRFSPLMTIGGGEILDPAPRRRKRTEGFDDLTVYEQGSLEEKISMKIFHTGLDGMSFSNLEGWIKNELPQIDSAINTLIKKGEIIRNGNWLLHRVSFENFSRIVLNTTKEFHEKNPLRPGIPKEMIRALFRWIDGSRISLSEDNAHIKGKIMKILKGSAYQPLSKDELAKAVSVSGKEIEELLKIMVSEGNLVRINDTIYLLSANYSMMIDKLRSFFKTKTDMTVGEFRDILGTSRKYALPFLEYLDSNKVTLRVGEIRKFLKES